MPSSFGKPNKASPLKKAFRLAVLGVVLASGWADYQYWTPDAQKDKVGQKVEQVTHSSALGSLFGEKQPGVKANVQVTLPKAPGN